MLEVRARLVHAERSFVRAVAAVILLVAFPVVGDAFTVAALEKAVITFEVGTVFLVREIFTVVIGVTFEHRRDTFSRVTAELVRFAGYGSAVLLLVRIVETIIRTVANPGLLDTSAIGAREVPRGARGFIGFRLWVEFASLQIGRQHFSLGASTAGNKSLRGVVRDGEAELLAAMRRGEAGVRGGQVLGTLTVHLDAVEAVALVDLNDEGLVASVPLVHPEDGVVPPLRHVEPFIEDDEREGVPDAGRGDHLHVGAVQVRELNVIQQRVAPVNLVGEVVDGQAVGPA